jgi:hypothetical protein
MPAIILRPWPDHGRTHHLHTALTGATYDIDGGQQLVVAHSAA